MRLSVVTPVGPGHERTVEDAVQSVMHAWESGRGAFTSLRHEVILDTDGALGRSAARNKGIRSHPADWYFLLDADDLLMPLAFDVFEKADMDAALVFGAVCTDTHGIIRENVCPLDWDGLMRFGARGTLSMGCFVRADVAHAVPFAETLDAGEDFDFYLRACSMFPWEKLAEPLVTIRTRVPSATGPRGYESLDWRTACDRVINPWRCREVEA